MEGMCPNCGGAHYSFHCNQPFVPGINVTKLNSFGGQSFKRNSYSPYNNNNNRGRGGGRYSARGGGRHQHADSRKRRFEDSDSRQPPHFQNKRKQRRNY